METENIGVRTRIKTLRASKSEQKTLHGRKPRLYVVVCLWNDEGKDIYGEKCIIVVFFYLV